MLQVGTVGKRIIVRLLFPATHLTCQCGERQLERQDADLAVLAGAQTKSFPVNEKDAGSGGVGKCFVQPIRTLGMSGSTGG